VANGEPRRDALKILGAIGSTCLFPFQADELYGQHEHSSSPARPAYVRSFFKDEDFTTLSAFVDILIPETDTPGASAAGVPLYIDYVASRNAKLGATLRRGLGLLRRKRFSRLNTDARERVAQELCEAAERRKAKGAGPEFWVVVKNLTADGYYTSQIGIRDELGYKGNGVLESYPNCESVPEH
jgi:gluconate 2-dehydrogenase gamma chain